MYASTNSWRTVRGPPEPNSCIDAGHCYRALIQRHPCCRGVREDGCPVPGQGRQIALDVARGLHFLHRHFVVHFDLKSPNILLGRHNIAK